MAIQITFARGAVAQFNICGSATGMFDFAHFCGRDGHLYLAMATVPNYSLTVSSPGKEEYAVPKTTATALDRATAIQQKIEAELRDFATAVWVRRPPPITVSDGRKVLQVRRYCLGARRYGWLGLDTGRLCQKGFRLCAKIEACKELPIITDR
jgi:hypothetical protein